MREQAAVRGRAAARAALEAADAPALTRSSRGAELA